MASQFLRFLRPRPRSLLLILVLLALQLSASYLVYHRPPSSHHAPAPLNTHTLLAAVDAALEHALQRALAHARSSAAPASAAAAWAHAPRAPRNASAARARDALCAHLQGQTLHLAGPRGTTYALHARLLALLSPAGAPAVCPGPATCPLHALCHAPAAPRPLLPADIAGTRTALLRYVPADTLALPPTPVRFPTPVVDPRTGVRAVDRAWARGAARAALAVLGRAPLPAPAWSYAPGARLAWADALHGAGDADAHALAPLFAGVPDVPAGDGAGPSARAVRAALHTTVRVFVPEVLATLGALRDGVLVRGRQPVPVVWHGSWYLPLGAGGDLGRLLQRADAAQDPWNAYYNAQVYMHDRLLAGLLPEYGIRYIPLSGAANASYEGAGRGEGENADALGKSFLDGLADALDAWPSPAAPVA
ncbi:hypothetical protein FA95DRAFT_1601280 [Auriscalpium vulgare]|uniref:Uncharacterized protein n=1 Tax=Auriscalpium vulgare TaxID=40419 RepID=A0ACB8SBF8_9AGAM|nr:hypothetical protein FA95DRAFT_1601280 [Auriscalpium vulgare]